jgi:hypothetical protein
MKKQNAGHELQRKDFQTVYHYRAAVRLATCPSPWPNRGHWVEEPFPSGEWNPGPVLT